MNSHVHEVFPTNTQVYEGWDILDILRGVGINPSMSYEFRKNMINFASHGNNPCLLGKP